MSADRDANHRAGDPRDRVLEQALATLLEPDAARATRARAIARAFAQAAAAGPAAGRDTVADAANADRRAQPVAVDPGRAPRNGAGPSPGEGRRPARSGTGAPDPPTPGTSTPGKSIGASIGATSARPRRAWWVAGALAAAAVAAITVAWWRADGAAPAAPVVARSARPVAVERAAGGSAHRVELATTDVRAGDRVRTDGAAAELAVPGGRIELSAWTLLALPTATADAIGAPVDAGPPELVLGEVRAVADARLELRLGATLATLAPDTVLLAALEAAQDPPIDGGASGADGDGPRAHPAHAWRAAGGPRVLRYAVAAGTVELASAGGTRRLSAGDAGALRDGEARPATWTSAERKELLAELERAWPYQPAGVDPDASAFRDFCARLDDLPGAWDVILDAARKELDDPALPAAAKGAWIDALCLGASPGADRAARALWLGAPELFAPWHVVWLAERGAFEMQRELRAAVAGGELGEDELLPAVALALRGDPAALVALHGVEERPADSLAALDAGWLAAWALAAAGEPGAWERRLRRLDADVREALDARAVGRAARLVLNAEFFLAELRAYAAPPAEPADPGAIALVRVRHARHLTARGTEVRSSGEVLRALAALPR